MKLRIISGSLKGRMIAVPEKDTGFRPTRERIRESVASILSDRFRDSVVADFCAGSGAFGFEALSRGARRVIFIEADRNRCRLIREHAGRFGVEQQCSIKNDTIATYLKDVRDRFDIIYFDPPYDIERPEDLLEPMLCLLTINGSIVYERRSNSVLPFSGPLADALVDSRTYGETEICIFRTTKR